MKKIIALLSVCLFVSSVNAATNVPTTNELAKETLVKMGEALQRGDADATLKFAQAHVTLKTAPIVSLYTDILEAFEPQVKSLPKLIKAIAVANLKEGTSERGSKKAFVRWISANNDIDAEKAAVQVALEIEKEEIQQRKEIEKRWSK